MATARAVKDILNRQITNPNFSWRKFGIIFTNLKQHSKLVFWGILFTLATSVITLPLPMINRSIIDEQLKTKNVKMILILIGISGGIFILNLIFNTVMNYIFSTLNNFIMVDVKKSLLEKIISLPLSFFSENHSSYITARINEVNQLDSVFSISLTSFIVSSLTFIFSFVILACISWKLLLITLVILPVQYFIVKKFTGGIRNISQQAMEKNAVLNSNIQEVMAGIGTVKSFSAEAKEQQKIQNTMVAVAETSILQKIIYSLSNDMIACITNISGLVIFLVSMILIVKNEFTLGLYVACSQYVYQIMYPIQSFASVGIILQPMAVAVNRIHEYFEMLGEGGDKRRRYAPLQIKGRIEFQAVSFGYGEHLIFDAISFVINPGDKIAVLGANGCGKTTLLKLILQLELPGQGVISLDNVDLATYDLSNLRKKTGLVSQDQFLFNDTIKNNIIYGVEHYSEQELDDIVGEYAGFINELPDGLNTLAGEIGGNLSGGQKQSISILRTILKRPDILVFDEGSSHLDQASYRSLMGLIAAYFEEKTCIFITHDYQVLNQVNRVFWIENKKVILKSKEEIGQTAG